MSAVDDLFITIKYLEKLGIKLTVPQFNEYFDLQITPSEHKEIVKREQCAALVSFQQDSKLDRLIERIRANTLCVYKASYKYDHKFQACSFETVEKQAQVLTKQAKDSIGDTITFGVCVVTEEPNCETIGYICTSYWIFASPIDFCFKTSDSFFKDHVWKLQTETDITESFEIQEAFTPSKEYCSKTVVYRTFIY